MTTDYRQRIAFGESDKRMQRLQAEAQNELDALTPSVLAKSIPKSPGPGMKDEAPENRGVK